MAIFYHSRVNFDFPGLSRLHPANLCKYRQAYNLLKNDTQILGVDRNISTHKMLAEVHTQDYMRKVLAGDKETFALATEVLLLAYIPNLVSRMVLVPPIIAAVKQTITATVYAMTHRTIAVSLGGGFHHAKPDSGEGFCVLNDAAVSIKLAQSMGAKRVAYIDVDAHMGNGVAHCVMDDDSVYLFDMFAEDIYPQHDQKARERIDCPIPIESDASATAYLSELKQGLPDWLDLVEPDFIVVTAGQDVFEGDPLTPLRLTIQDVQRRDQFISRELQRLNCPAVILSGGGYTEEAGQILANTAKAML